MAAFPQADPRAAHEKTSFPFGYKETFPHRAPMGAGAVLPAVPFHFSFGNRRSKRLLLRLPTLRAAQVSPAQLLELPAYQ